MKRSLKLFNKKGKKPRRKQDIIDLDDEFSEDDFEEEYDDGYDEDDYPDEEFEREYGDSDEEDDDSDDEYADVYEDEYGDEEDFGEDDDNGADCEDEDIDESQVLGERYESDDDYREDDFEDDFEEAEKYTGKLGPSDAGEAPGGDHNYNNIVDFKAYSEQSDTEKEQSYRHEDEAVCRDDE
ncbi:MAG: hypothetical protein J5959_16000, partial [Butyrivibrio sp.]|nr:hypothetical protein [Butyrivibrio sp.]